MVTATGFCMEGGKIMKIQIRRGKEANLPILKEGELAFATDTNKIYLVNNGLNADITGAKTTATTSKDGLMSSTDKGKLDVCASLPLAAGNGTNSIRSSEANTDYTMGRCAVALGGATTASGHYSHAEGIKTTTSERGAHAEGVNTKALGDSSHAEGILTTASGDHAHAEGWCTTASGNSSHTGGYNTYAIDYETAIGHYNVHSTTKSSGADTSGNAFIVGNGTDGNALSNCFRVQYDGKIYSKGAYSTSGADMAELFEWVDGNPQKEDRRGLFVKLEQDKISIADSPTDFIIGIVSSNPSLLGNNHSETWNGMYLTDIWGDVILEHKTFPAEYKTITEIEYQTNENGEKVPVEVEKQILIHEAYEGDTPVINPEYDPSQEYIPRDKRPEWAAVGMFGQVITVDDGTCEAGGYCCCTTGGIATKAEKENGYYVMKRLDESHILILFLSKL